MKSWASTQKKVTLSSAEAELAACIKAACETIGILQMVASFGRTVEGEIMVDSSAALAVVNRKGNGKLRHIRVGQLWIQQTAEDETLSFKKVHGKQNPADICTKHVNQMIIDNALEKIGLGMEAGRAQESLGIDSVTNPEDWLRCNYGDRKVHWADAVEEEQQ